MLPSDAAYTTAFLVSAGVATAAAIVAVLIPRAGEPAPVHSRQPRVGAPAYAER